MNVVRAETLGMCFGVRDALALLDRVERPERVTVHGELVHNDEVLRRLESRGFRQSAEDRRTGLPMTDTVMVTAHGISQRERARLAAAGKTLLDSTCPLVTRAHDAAMKLAGAGYHVLVIGRPGHVEVRGIVEDLDSYTLVPDAESVIEFPEHRLGVMCQTTTPTRTAEAILAEIRRKNPDAEIRYVDTICLPTKEHQQALESLLDQVAVVVVVGGRNSNNTRQLVERCKERGVRAHHVETAGDLRCEWFAGVERVGLTAGTSTLAETIDSVERELRRMKNDPKPGDEALRVSGVEYTAALTAGTR